MSIRSLGLVSAALVLGAPVGCGTSTSGTGMFAVQLVDAPSPDVKSLFVTISDVTVHSNQSGWVNVFQGPLTVDLLALPTTPQQLGAVPLPGGEVTQIRLELAPAGPQYVVLTDGTHQGLFVPSGTESGVKLNGQFPVTTCNLHTVTLDFDGKNSIEFHQTGGPSPTWILRPVVRVKAEADEGLPCSSMGGGMNPHGG
jgi:hypothetical protein